MQEVFEGAAAFAERIPHTGSRADYWPHLYANVRQTAADNKYTPRLEGCSLLPNAAPLYSPPLVDAWPDQSPSPVERYDWFAQLDCLRYFRPFHPPLPYDMSGEHCFAIRKLELAAAAGQALSKHDI